MKEAGCCCPAALGARFYFKTPHNDAAPALFMYSSDTKQGAGPSSGALISVPQRVRSSFLMSTQTGVEAALHKRCGSREFAERAPKYLMVTLGHLVERAFSRPT